RIDMLPYSCQVIIQQTDKSETYYYDRNDKSGMMKPVLPDVVTDSLERYSKKLFRTRILEQSESAGIPTMLTFLELYRAGRVEDLVISKRWAQSQPQSSLEAPLGITEGGEVFSLDIHESFHGPHGLIAGTTGSGKSEFIQSYILSMAINFHPYDVSFILIDYKGGGMANCFRGLPHVAGTITNLGGNMIHRSLVSLRSEMDRRQAIFAANDVNHIDKYQKLYKEKKVTIPLPHLVIISDEFAELKEQQHEFMKELVSAARIGRSLGVHLILATQKPSSSVSDEIRSNTRFRACLKVNTTEDSKDMLKRPEAAEITLPGRGYVQVGNDELFKLVQSGWSGAPYVPSEKYEPADVQSVSLLSANGLAAHVAKPEKPSGKGAKSQLDTIVQFINDYSERMSITPLRMWLDPMPAIMSWSALKKPAGGFDGHKWTPYPEWLNPTIGQYDDPPAQFQGPLSMNIGANGHVAIFGAPTTGKTTFVQTLIYSLVMNHSPEDLNMYLLDFGGRILGNFQALPHVGDVVFSDDEGKLNKLFKLLSDELAERKKLFGSRGVASLQSYRETTGKKLPAILFILDNYAAFNETYPDAETNIITLSREGANCGIYLVLTASASSVIKFKVIQNFKLMYALNLNDKYDYTNVVGQTGGMEPDALKGRGLAKVGRPVEFQIALAEGIEGDAERSAKLKEIFAQMDNSWTGERAKSIPIVPEDLTMPSLLLRADFVSAAKSALIPIAYDIEEAKLITITPRAQTFFNVMGLDGSGKTTFLKSIVEYVNEKHGWPVHVVDSADGAWQDMASSVDSYADSVESLETLMKKVLNRLLSRRQQVKALAGDQAALKTLAESFTPEIVIIDDFPQFYTLLNDVSMNCLENIIKGAGGLGGLFFVAADGENLNSFVGEKIYPHVFSGKLGIQLGGRFTLQNVYKQNLPFDLQSIDCQPGQGFYLNGNNYNLIKTFRP
ncbi:MAG: type VII secretion protein EssC, partial [Clostridiales bacterium]|nr:type VII secretion protein EssC [Clostridiales bacterium]